MPSRRPTVLAAIRLTSVIAIVLAVGLAAFTLPITRLATAVTDAIAELGPWGPLALGGVYVLATVLMLPGSILTLAAGAMFGLVVGLITASLASVSGAALAFLIARYFARPQVARFAQRNRRFRAIDAAIGAGGWKIVALLRLSPAIPFNVQNYLYGLTPIRFVPYVFTSWWAMLPGTLMYVYLGHITGAAVRAGEGRTAMEWALLAVGLVATIVVTVYITRLARAKLDEQMQQAGQDAELDDAPVDPTPPVLGTLEWVKAGLLALFAAGLLTGSIVLAQSPDWLEDWLPEDTEAHAAMTDDSN